MHRLLYAKEGNAIWISHLDLMRTFQRVFQRADVRIKHTEGFNPHPFVSIALPLSVGTESQCEILDFELQDSRYTLAELPERLNPAFPAGIRVLEAYESDRKIKHLTHLQAQVVLEYDNGIPAGAEEAIAGLFDRAEIVIEKKTKKGPADADIKPMIGAVRLNRLSEQELALDARICAQNPSLNPDYLAKAIGVHLPEYRPDFARARRVEVYDADGEVFR